MEGVYPDQLEFLIRANHILHYNNVVDAYGHVSMRHSTNPSLFIMSGDRAPALVISPQDLVKYNISDGSPANPTSLKGYQERFIHSEIYKRYPHINSVIHSHSEDVLPYTMNGVSMKPVFHIPGFLGTSTPIWDILPEYPPGYPNSSKDMLVNTTQFGSSLASTFSNPSSKTSMKEHAVVLMANHGFTVIGTSIKEAVYRAVYTHKNASIQSSALMLRNAALGAGEKVGEMRYLGEEQVEGSLRMNEKTMERPWGLWIAEVENCRVYEIEDRDWRMRYI